MQCFISVSYLQAKREAEITNRTLLQELKTQLAQAKRMWPDELYYVLWAYWTMQRIPTSETSFNLVFGIEAIIPLKLGLPSLWIENFHEDSSSEQLRMN